MYTLGNEDRRSCSRNRVPRPIPSSVRSCPSLDSLAKSHGRPAQSRIDRDTRILATGYNGAPRGLPHCPVSGEINDWPIGCLMAGHCIRSLHAEQNALLQAAMIGVPCEGSTMYVTCQPCNTCAKMQIN